MKCKKNYKFVINSNEYIELRHKNGTLITSICCRQCAVELRKMIDKLLKTKATA